MPTILTHRSLNHHSSDALPLLLLATPGGRYLKIISAHSNVMISYFSEIICFIGEGAYSLFGHNRKLYINAKFMERLGLIIITLTASYYATFHSYSPIFLDIYVYT